MDTLYIRELEGKLADSQRALQQKEREIRAAGKSIGKLLAQRDKLTISRDEMQARAEAAEARVKLLEDERVSTMQRYIQEIHASCDALDNRLRHLDVMAKYTNG